jgi:L-lysine 6-transaminase
MSVATRIAPQEAIGAIARRMIADRFDLVVDLERSHGSYLVDARDGREYLDFFTFIASNALGMNHPKLAEPSFRERLGRVAVHKPTNSDIYTVEMAEFVEAFSRHALPGGMPHLFLVEGGSVAVENALKAAFDWKVRRNFRRGHREEIGHQVIHFRECFHGRTGYAISMTNTDPAKTLYFPKFSWPRVDNPKARFPLAGENLRQVQEAEARAVDQIEAAFAANPDDVAALIIEPIQGEGGDNHFRGEFFRELRRLADERGAMLIFDEVQTGVGLTGRFWAWEHFGVRPDILVFAKKMQVCGIVVSERIDEEPENVFRVASRINSTWGGNLTDCVRATRILEVIAEDRLVDNAAAQGQRLLRGLAALRDEFPALVSNPRGRGLMCAIDLPDGAIRDRLQKAAFARGLFALPSGRAALRCRPPLTVQAGEIDRGLELLRDALRSLA